MTHPTDAEALLSQTDLYIRQIAEAANTALDARPLFATPGPATQTDSWGDIEIPFPSLSRIDGVILQAHGGASVRGQVSKVRPPGITIDLFMPNQPPILQIYSREAMNTRPGVVRAHVFVRAYFSGGSGRTAWSYGMQRAAQGQTVMVGGIAWGAPA